MRLIPLLCLSAVAASAHAETRFQRLVSEGHTRSAASAPRGAAPVYETGFEASEGYTLGDLDGQLGWETLLAEVVDDTLPAPLTGHAARITPDGFGPGDFGEAFRAFTPEFGVVTLDLVFDELATKRGAVPNSSVIVFGGDLDPVHAIGFDVTSMEISAITSFVSPPVFVGTFQFGVPVSLRLENLGDGRQRVFINGNNVVDVPSLAAMDGAADPPSDSIVVDADSMIVTFDNLRFDQASTCPADLDGNGVVDSSDLAIVLAGWGGCL